MQRKERAHGPKPASRPKEYPCADRTRDAFERTCLLECVTTRMENANVPPSPLFGSAQMWPWCLLMIERLSDSPIPMPPPERTEQLVEALVRSEDSMADP